YAVFLKNPDGLGSALKELAFNDYYRTDDLKAGTVQAFGALPPAQLLVAELEKELRGGRRPWLVPLFRLAKPFLRRYLSPQSARALLLRSIAEDLPDRDNRVAPAPDGSGLVLEYRLRDFERGRIRALRQRMAETLKPYSFMLLKQAENNERIAHACGTC